MPANFPEIWLDRVINNISNADLAPWLDGIPELDAEVSVHGEGTLTESNTIHVATTDFDVDVLINNTTYPIPVQVYDDETVFINLDKYVTKVVNISDDQAMGASYDRIDNATRKSTEAIPKAKYAKAIHSIAPQKNTTNTPVIEATGETDPSGRKTLVYNDLVSLKNKLDDLEVPQEDRRLVLCTNHYNDLLKDRKNFGNVLVDYKKGMVAPIIAGFEIFSYIKMPTYSDSLEKIPYGAIPDPTKERKASVAFYKGNIAKKTGITKQYFGEAKTNPSLQVNELNYRHYFIATPFVNKYIGAIV